jgi:hypothetical protein
VFGASGNNMTIPIYDICTPHSIEPSLGFTL